MLGTILMANGSDVLILLKIPTTVPLSFTSFTAIRLPEQTTYGGAAGDAPCGAEGFGCFHTDHDLVLLLFLNKTICQNDTWIDLLE